MAAFALGLLVAAQAEARIDLTKTDDVGSAHGLRYLFGTEAPFSAPGTETVAVCPEGEAPVGGGADVGGAPSLSRITTSTPFFSIETEPPEGWRAGAETEIPSTALDVWVICRKAGFDRLQYVTEEVGISAGEIATATAPCPGGTQAISGGAWLNVSAIRQSAPFDDSDRNRKPDDGWRATAKGGPGVGMGSLQVVAVCLDSSRREIAYARESARVRRSKVVKATCPKSKSVVGGGWSIRGADNFTNATKPLDSRADRRKVPDDRWAALLVNTAPEDGRKRGVVHAICRG